MNKVERAKALYPFLLENLHLSPAEFILKYKSKLGDEIQFGASQLNGMRKAKKKLPTWFENDAILYPPNLNLEQSSSELTSIYKRQFFKGLKSSVDLTGGFGVDSWAIAQEAKEHTYVEPNTELLEIVKSNTSAFKIQNLKFNNSIAEDWLDKDATVEAIYLDPSRRVEGQKKFILTECVPDVVTLQNVMLKNAQKVLIKLSPLADLKAIHTQLKNVSEIHVVAVKNEVKELLVLQCFTELDEPIIKTINYRSTEETDCFSFLLSQEQSTQVGMSAVKTFIYEPNAAILKAGAFKLLASRMGLRKLHANTHLYTSDEQVKAFPGRVFKLNISQPKKVNIIARNHPLKPKEIAKKYKVKEGAKDDFLLAFRDIEKPKICYCKLLN
ncbi:MAG: hypothetical protein JXQ87_09555 [Bacteroidia bacterium]